MAQINYSNEALIGQINFKQSVVEYKGGKTND